MTRCPSVFLRAQGVALSLLLVLTLGACASSRTHVAEPFEEWAAEDPPARDSLAFRVFLVGNTATEPGGEAAALDALKAQLAEAGEASAVVFLGDQILRPLPDSLAADRAEVEAFLRELRTATEAA